MNIYASFLHIVPLDMKNPLERSNYFNIMISITFYFPIEIFNCLISFANYCGVFDFFNENNFFFSFFWNWKKRLCWNHWKKRRRLLLVNFFFRHSFTLFCVAVFFNHKLITVFFNEFQERLLINLLEYYDENLVKRNRREEIVLWAEKLKVESSRIRCVYLCMVKCIDRFSSLKFFSDLYRPERVDVKFHVVFLLISVSKAQVLTITIISR